ncbi:MAG: hypothetical protein AAGK09_14435 [Planctomycetota bacterium]
MDSRLPSLFTALLTGLLATAAYAAEHRVATQANFDRLKSATFQPGDRILFQRGRSFTGMFAPKGDGAPDAPITIDAFGTGDLPQIHAGGQHPAAVFLHNVIHWEVRHLEVTNTDGSPDGQGNLFGIYVLADEQERTVEHIHIDRCFVHHVNGLVAGKRRGGIHVHMKELEHSTFNNLRITHNRVEHVGGVGIGNDSTCARVHITPDGVTTQNLWTNVYVADNYVGHTGRNNVIARVSKDAIYERNTLAYSSRFSTGHSIFCFNTDGIKIQFNEAYGNIGPGSRDRGGFDADYNCVHTFIQYNYSHDNQWFCGIMKRPNRHVVIRYNLSVNDRDGIYFYGFNSRQQADDIHIYNNTHYVARGLEAVVFPERRTPLNSRFENNIFYFQGEGGWGPRAEGINTTFRNNVYHRLTPHPTDDQARTTSPHFVDPGQAPTNIDLTTMQALVGYRLKPDSPYRQGGTLIEDRGAHNLLKESLTPGVSAYGAF